MIVIRRFFAILLIPVFLSLFLATLLVFRVNDTLLEPTYYTDTFLDLDLFNFIYDEGIPSVVADAEKDGRFPADQIPLGIDVSPEGISSNIKRVLPPDWLEDNVTTVINAAVPYMTGEDEHLQITIVVDDRIEAATEVFNEMLLEADIHGYLVGEVVTDQIDESDILGQLPLGMTLTSQQLVDGIVEIVPEAWFREQVAGVIDEVTPYLLGREDTFSITIPVQERAETGIDVVEGWVLTSLEGEGAYEFLLEEQIAPVVQASLGAVVELPYGVTFTNAEIVNAISQVLPVEWVTDRVQETVDAVGPYMIGRTESFVIVVPLADRATLASSVLVDVADAKFAEIYTSLRVCSVEELLSLSLSLDALPACRPPLISYAQLKGVVGLDVLEQLVAAIVEPLPDSIALTDEQVFAQFGDNSPVSIEDLREILRDGYTFTEEDLESLIRAQASDYFVGNDNVRLLHRIRGYLRDGFTFDDTQLREIVGRDSELELFDSGRGYIGLGRDNISFLLIVPGIIALIIGLLGGRRWGSRLAWAGLPVLISGALAAIAMGPLAAYGFEILDDVIRQKGFSFVFTEKLIDTRIEMELSFLAPMASQSGTVAIVGVVMVILGMMLAKRRRHKPRVPKQGRALETQGSQEIRNVVDSLKDELATED
jgi:hypothetical protein